jgi:type I restriction enzyme, S subunit
LGEIGEITTGNTPSKDNKEYYGGNIPFFKPTDLEQGIDTKFSNDKLSQLGFESSRKLPANTVLVTCIGATIGKTGLISVEGSCNQQINAIVPTKSIIPYFLYYACVSEYMQNEIKSNASATTLPILNKGNFSKIAFPLPPLEEQKRIVSEIERWMLFVNVVESGKSDLQKIIIQAKSKILDLAIHGKLVPQDPNDEPASELLKRINPKAEITCDNPQYGKLPFVIPSSWEWVKLSGIAKSNIGLTYRPTDIVSTGVPVYRSNNIRNGKIDTTDLVKVSTKILEKQLLHVGDLLICARNGSRNLIGKNAIISELKEPTSFGAFMAVCRSAYNQWIRIVLNSEYFDRYLDDSNSATINQVTQKMLLALPIPLPPHQEQHRIVAKIEELFAQLDKIEASL